MTSVTSAMPIALRDDEPAKITSSARRVRNVRPCSPSVQRRASARLLLPLPLGPTTALIPGPNSIVVRSANDLKPTRRNAVSRALLTRACLPRAQRLQHLRPAPRALLVPPRSPRRGGSGPPPAQESDPRRGPLRRSGAHVAARLR